MEYETELEIEMTVGTKILLFFVLFVLGCMWAFFVSTRAHGVSAINMGDYALLIGPCLPLIWGQYQLWGKPRVFV